KLLGENVVTPSMNPRRAAMAQNSPPQRRHSSALSERNPRSAGIATHRLDSPLFMEARCAPLLVQHSTTTTTKRARLSRRSLLLGAAALGVESTRLAAGALAGGCSAPRTAGSRVRITTRARSDVSDSSKLTNAFGWQVELTLARLALEQLY